MPDMPGRPPSRLDRWRMRADVQLYWMLRNGLLAAAGVAALAVALAYFHIELQFVVGAFLCLFARRLAEKQLAPQIREQRKQETPQRGPWRDPMASLGDFRMRYPPGGED